MENYTLKISWYSCDSDIYFLGLNISHFTFASKKRKKKFFISFFFYVYNYNGYKQIQRKCECMHTKVAADNDNIQEGTFRKNFESHNKDHRKTLLAINENSNMTTFPDKLEANNTK